MTIRSIPCGRITVFTGPMRSRKTLEVIIIAHEAGLAGKRILCFHPSHSERWGEHNNISSRLKYSASSEEKKLSYPSIPINRDLTGIDSYIDDNTDIVIFDDAHFFSSSIITVANKLRDNGTTVFISGLDMDCFKQPFGPMPFLMAIADSVEKRTSICHICGEPAQLSVRITDVMEQELVGDDEYVVLCHDCARNQKIQREHLKQDIGEDLCNLIEEVYNNPIPVLSQEDITMLIKEIDLDTTKEME